jgi:Glycosyl hydrolases family 18/Chitinase A, N-terminal domain
MNLFKLRKPLYFTLLACTVMSGAAHSAAPAAPQIAWMPTQVPLGSSGSVKWNIWWQQPNQTGTSWSVNVNGTNLFSSTTFSANTPNTQAGETNQFTFSTPGTKSIVVSVCNDSGKTCTNSAPYVVNVTGTKAALTDPTTAPTAPTATATAAPTVAAPTAAAPVKPQIAWAKPTLLIGEGVQIAWNIWWQQPNQAATSWYLSVNGVKEDKTLMTRFEQVTPNTMSANIPFSFTTAGLKSVTVTVCNNNGVQCATSAPYVFNVEAQKTATTPVTKSTTDAPVTKSTTDAPVTKSTTDAPVTKSTTDAPVTKSTTDAPTAANGDPLTVASSVKANAMGRHYVGYYPTWSDNWFSSTSWDGKPKSADEILASSNLAKLPATYNHVMLAFADPNFSFNGKDWNGTGINFNASPADIKQAIAVLHKRGIKVFMAIGGATYNNWGGLASEAKTGGPITNSLTSLINYLDLDGLDVDFEVEGTTPALIDMYAGAIQTMSNAVKKANSAGLLTLAGWSTGMDCTAQAPCNEGVSNWSGSAGRERMVFTKYPQLLSLINEVSIMSYDALGTAGPKQHYDPVKAWQQYRDFFPATTVVNMGLENAPEGWAGGLLVNNDADAMTCAGAGVTMIVDDQYGNLVNKPYSVVRTVGAVFNKRPNSNPRDGAMLWQVLKPTQSACQAAATPSSIMKLVAPALGLPLDARSGNSIYAK